MSKMYTMFLLTRPSGFAALLPLRERFSLMFPLAVKLKPLLRMLTAGITPNTKPIRAI